MPLSKYLLRLFTLSFFITTATIACESNSPEARRPNLLDQDLPTPLDGFDPITAQDLGLNQSDMTLNEEPNDQEISAEQDLELSDSQVADQPLDQLKSRKRGIAFGFESLADFTAISSGISWWYNWSPSYNSVLAEHYQDLKVDWIPMTWNGNNPDQIRAFLDDHPEVQYLLTYNEPNFQDQANLTPAYAASIWPSFEQIAEDYDVKLVGPAMNYCGGCVIVDGEPLGSNYTIWLDLFFEEFRSQFGREPKMDFTALHWYDYGLEDQVNEMVTRYGKPVWLTEFALWRYEDWCTDELEQEWMLDMLEFLEAHPMVYRYSWFTGRRPDFPKINLFAEDGTLTALGEAYVNAPYASANEGTNP